MALFRCTSDTKFLGAQATPAPEERGEEEKGEGQEDEEECEHLDINNRQLILRRTRQADTCKPLFPKPAPVLSNLLSLHGGFPGFFV